MPKTYDKSYPSVAASVPLARRAIAEFAVAAGATPAQTDAVRWAASEALTNVVVHAYPGGTGEIHVTAGMTDGTLSVFVADDGCGLAATSDRPGLGLGLQLMARNCDDLVIAKRASGGVEIRMRFKLAVGRTTPEGHDRGSLACARRPASSRFSTTT